MFRKASQKARWLLLPISRLSLTKRFALISLAILITGMLVIGWWVTREIESGVMNRNASVTASFVTSSVAPHLQNVNDSDGISEEQMEALDSLLFETELGQRIVSFKVWSQDGRILYSPNKNLVGQTFQVDAELQQALRGETVSHVSDLSDPENLYERERFSRLQETYTPLRTLGTGEISGVVEFYKGTAALDAEVQDARLRSWLIVGGATLVMYVLLVRMIKGASLTIGRQRRDLARAAAQRELDRMKAEFTSAVSHELRTPLGFIKGYATTMLRDDLTIDEATRQEFLQVIDEESSKLQWMIDDLLDASRLQAGELQLKQEEIPLREFLESSLAKSSPSLKDKGHTLIRELDAGTYVWADPARIEQVLHNLVNNAARYSDPGSSITVKAVVHDKQAVVSVIDHGDGIPHHELKRVFDPFYRGENSERRGVAGVGLGLSISHSIIESHGCRLWVDSEPGRGSIFSFTLPLSATERAEDSAVEVEHEAHPGSDDGKREHTGC